MRATNATSVVQATTNSLIVGLAIVTYVERITPAATSKIKMGNVHVMTKAVHVCVKAWWKAKSVAHVVREPLVFPLLMTMVALLAFASDALISAGKRIGYGVGSVLWTPEES